MSAVETMHFPFPTRFIPQVLRIKLSKKPSHSKHKFAMSYGQDKDHPIELDDNGPESDNQVPYPPRRRRSRELTHGRATAMENGSATMPLPTYNRFSPPPTDEPRLLDDNIPLRRHRKKHRENARHPDRQEENRQQQPGQTRDGSMGTYLNRAEDATGDYLNPDDGWLPQGAEFPPDDFLLGFGDDNDLAFWGQYHANEPLFPEDERGVLPEDIQQNEPANVLLIPRDQPRKENERVLAWHDNVEDNLRQIAHNRPRTTRPDEARERVRLRLATGADEADVEPIGHLPRIQDFKEHVSVTSASSSEDLAIVGETSVAIVDQAQEDACLAKILEVFPDICRDHIRELYQDRRDEDFKYSAIRADRHRYDPSEVLIQKILESAYPKQKDTKRKRARSATSSDGGNERWRVGEGCHDRLYLEMA
jgi:hypothetical protein